MRSSRKDSRAYTAPGASILCRGHVQNRVAEGSRFRGAIRKTASNLLPSWYAPPVLPAFQPSQSAMLPYPHSPPCSITFTARHAPSPSPSAMLHYPHILPCSPTLTVCHAPLPSPDRWMQHVSQAHSRALWAALFGTPRPLCAACELGGGTASGLRGIVMAGFARLVSARCHIAPRWCRTVSNDGT